jgi:hypothetical protein
MKMTVRKKRSSEPALSFFFCRFAAAAVGRLRREDRTAIGCLFPCAEREVKPG